MAFLTGVSVLDLSRMLPGPLCSWYLQGLGATVDRVESVEVGDLTRSIPPFEDGVGVFFGALNRGNRSCALNLRHPDGLSALRALIPHYDVLIEGFRPGVMEAIGFPMEALKALNPRIVVARLSGYGQTGPWAQRPGHDVNYVGLAGLPNWGENCATPAAQIADTAGAQVAALGVVSALFGRHATGEGAVLDISLAEAALGVMGPHIAMASQERRAANPGRELLTGLLPSYGTYLCGDGKWLTVGALEPKFQAELSAQVGSLTRDDLRSVFRSQPRDEWCELLAKACVGPSLEPDEIAQHPQHAFRDSARKLGQATFVRPPFSGADWHTGTVPDLGQHSREILVEAGVGAEVISHWTTSGGVKEGS
jgi:alpha-methylacyl-CoA racemase